MSDNSAKFCTNTDCIFRDLMLNNATYCTECDNKLIVAEKLLCRSCREELCINERYCGKCGTRVEK